MSQDVWSSEATYSKREGGGKEGELSEEKNNLLNEKEFDRSAIPKIDKFNLS